MKNCVITLIFIIFGGNTLLISQNLSEIINSEDVLLVDVRTEEEFDEGSVEGAVNIPLSRLSDQISVFEGKKNIVLFCRSGRRSQKALEFLKTQGIKTTNGINSAKIKALRKEKIVSKEAFRTENPSIYVVKNGKNVRQTAISLQKNTILNKQIISESATLIVVKGKIRIFVSNEEIVLSELEVYQIPIDIEYQIIGLDNQNVFVITQGV